jgi:endonuclease/exonuclease/phosphatase family metal-dependent hydrolase
MSIRSRGAASVGIWAVLFKLFGLDLAGGLVLGALLLLVAAILPDPLISRTPDPEEPCTVVQRGPTAELMEKGAPIKVMSWNLQFCAGRDHFFWYDGGKAVSVPISDVNKTMKIVADIISDCNPDIVLLQEVDMNSKRTCYINQLEGILKHLDPTGKKFPYVSSTPYHQCNYVPAPDHEHMGKVDFHMAVLSKFPIAKATRHQLPLLNESWLRRLFNLKRAVMDVRFDIQGGGEFSALNTHLSAFAFNDGTPEKEISMLIDHTAKLDAAGVSWILAGDFNQLPPGDDPKRLGEDSQYYSEHNTPIAALLEKQRSAMEVKRWEADPAAFDSYLPFNKDVPDRVLDWMFVSKDLGISEFEVLQKHRHVSTASDHLPLATKVTLK